MYAKGIFQVMMSPLGKSLLLAICAVDFLSVRACATKIVLHYFYRLFFHLYPYTPYLL